MDGFYSGQFSTAFYEPQCSIKAIKDSLANIKSADSAAPDTAWALCHSGSQSASSEEKDYGAPVSDGDVSDDLEKESIPTERPFSNMNS